MKTRQTKNTNRKRNDYHSLDYEDMMRNKEIKMNEQEIKKEIEKAIKYHYQNECLDCASCDFDDGYKKGIQETNAKWKEAVQKLKEELRLIRKFGGRRCDPTSNYNWGHDKVWINTDWSNIEESINEIFGEIT